MAEGHYSRWLNSTSRRLSTFDRVRVEVAETSFFEGREFHAIYIDDAISNGEVVVLRVIAPVNTIVHDLSLTIDTGHVHAELWAGGTPTGTFGSTGLFIHGANDMEIGEYNRRDYGGGAGYVRQVTFESGGTAYANDGQMVDRATLQVANATGQASTLGTQGGYLVHGMPPGTYYLVIRGLAATSSLTLKARWEERP